MTRIRNLVLVVSFAAVAAAGCTAEPAGASAEAPVPSEQPSQAAPPRPSASAPAPSLEPLSADQTWAMLFAGDPASISYRSLAAIARDADLVVIASPGDIVEGPATADEYGQVAYMATLSLNVERVLRGAPNFRRPGSVSLWVLLGVGDSAYDFRADLERLQANPPRGRAIFFLSNMAEWVRELGGDPASPQADPFAYEVLGGQGFLRDVGGRVEPPRLSEDALVTMAGRWQEDLRGRPFDEVLRSLDAIAAQTP